MNGPQSSCSASALPSPLDSSKLKRALESFGKRGGPFPPSFGSCFNTRARYMLYTDLCSTALSGRSRSAPRLGGQLRGTHTEFSNSSREKMGSISSHCDQYARRCTHYPFRRRELLPRIHQQHTENQLPPPMKLNGSCGRMVASRAWRRSVFSFKGRNKEIRPSFAGSGLGGS